MEEEYSVLDYELQKLQAQGNYKKILRILEKLIKQQKENNVSFDMTKNKACDIWNIIGVKLLQEKEYEESRIYLEKALKYAENDTLALTYNNLACYYRQKGQLRVALDYLLKVRKLEPDPVCSNMNACVVYSQLGRHEDARDAALAAVGLLQAATLRAFVPKMNRKRGQAEGGDAESVETEFKERVANLVIWYRNLAVEYEFLKENDLSTESYERAKDIAIDYLGEKDEITISVIKTYKKALESYH